MRSRAGRTTLIILGVLAVLGLIAIWVMFLPPFHVAERFAEPEFCASCHVMEPQYAAWEAGSHNHLDSCNDCHLPNTGFVRHYAAEAFVGVRDLVEFNLNMIPEQITARERSRGWIEENCIRCHGDLTEPIHSQEESRRCWECHRELFHDEQLRIEGIEPEPYWPDEE